jgi:SOS response regulatory protein OraA/RecX
VVAERLTGEGFGSEDVRAALAALVPEQERARPLAARTEDRRRAWQLLARRGFAAETIEDVVGVLDEDR